MPEPDYYVTFRYESLKAETDLKIEEQTRSRTLDILRNCRLWFPSPTAFPDIYDCNPQWVYIPGNESELFKLGMEEMKKKKGVETLSPQDMQELHDTVLGTLKTNLVTTGVKCFCGKEGGDANNALMWELYADRHKGICLVFKVHPPFFEKLRQVKYKKTKQPAEMFPQSEEGRKAMFGLVFLQKHISYDFEDEYRVVIQNGADKHHQFPKELLAEIQFGWKTSKADIDAVIEILLGAKYPRVKLFQMEPNPAESNYAPKPYGEIIDGRAIFTIDASIPKKSSFK